jgi:hypothetical protein
MATDKKYTPPQYPSKNQDAKNNSIMKIFNDIKENTRMEITDQFNLGTFPSNIAKLKK